MKLAHRIIACAALSLGTAAWAKLPPPSPEAKAKTEEAAAKGKWGDKVAAYQLCQAQNKVAAYYEAHAKQRGESTPPPVPTPPCVDPGPFAYSQPEATPAPSPDKK